MATDFVYSSWTEKFPIFINCENVEEIAGRSGESNIPKPRVPKIEYIGRRGEMGATKIEADGNTGTKYARPDSGHPER